MRTNILRATNVVLGLLCLMYFLTYLDRVNISTAMASSQFLKDIPLTKTQAGLIFSAFAYPYLLFQISGGWVADKFGPRVALTICGIIWASATIMTGLVHGIVMMFIARVVLGFGEGATFPGCRVLLDMQAMNRREVIFRVGGILLAIPASRVLMACGSDSGSNPNSIQFTSSNDDSHTHTVDLATADINSPPAGGRIETTSLNNSHTHTVSLTEADFASIDAGGSVTKTTSEDETPGHVHTHTFTFHK